MVFRNVWIWLHGLPGFGRLSTATPIFSIVISIMMPIFLLKFPYLWSWSDRLRLISSIRSFLLSTSKILSTPWKVDDSCRLAGTLRIYINLIKPVKMSLRQTMELLPVPPQPPPQPPPPPPQSSDVAATGANPLVSDLAAKQDSDDAQPDIPAPARLVSFFLPRGTSKVVYITRLDQISPRRTLFGLFLRRVVHLSVTLFLRVLDTRVWFTFICVVLLR